MRRILAIVSRDIKSGTRDWLILYLSVAPILFAIVLSLFIPSAGNTSVDFVVDASVDPAYIQYLETYAQVELEASQKNVLDRVGQIDDVFGVIENNGKYQLLAQGNEVEGTQEVARLILSQFAHSAQESAINVTFSNVGWEVSPLKLEGANLLILLNTVLGGMLILLNLVEEKMSNTISAMNVTPTKRWEFIAGKGILGFALTFIGALAAVLILKFDGVHYGMLVVSVFFIGLIGGLIGFAIGITNNEPISAIASMKVIFVPILISVFGAMYLPGKWIYLIYWSPFYWAYEIIKKILLLEANWGDVALHSSVIFGTFIIVFLGLRKRIMNGMN